MSRDNLIGNSRINERSWCLRNSYRIFVNKISRFYGIDTPETEKKFITSNRNLEEMCKYIGADTLRIPLIRWFISINGVDSEGRNKDNPEYTDHCFMVIINKP